MRIFLGPVAAQTSESAGSRVSDPLNARRFPRPADWKSAIGSLAPTRSARQALLPVRSGNRFRRFPPRPESAERRSVLPWFHQLTPKVLENRVDDTTPAVKLCS